MEDVTGAGRVQRVDARRFVLDLVDELKAAGREVNLARLGEHTIAKTVCRHAVKANDPLGGAELENLVEDLRRCAMPYTCPHGRPTMRHLCALPKGKGLAAPCPLAHAYGGDGDGGEGDEEMAV